MTGPEHYRRAEQLVERVTRSGKGGLDDEIVVSDDASIQGTFSRSSTAD